MGRLLLVAGLVAVAGCKPDFGAPLSLVTAPRILAVRGTPAEAPPGATIAFDALVAAPEGAVDAPSLDWSLCRAARPVASNDVVDDSCLSLDQVQYLAYAQPTVTAPMPPDACQLFGPDLPPQLPGQPLRRPVLADATGGYYQPLRADLGSDFAVELARVRCNLAGASMDAALAFRARYHDNQNPRLDGVTASSPLDAIPPRATVTFTAAWSADSAETYPVLDLASQSLVDRREAMRVSWFASAGSFRDERTGRDETDPALTSSNDWTAPATAGPVSLWVVLRDSRGGVDWLRRPLLLMVGP